MRASVDAARIRAFMSAFGGAARQPVHVYLTGGASAVLEGWRASTLDIDIKLEPDDDALLRAVPALKESLQMNVELAAPIDFIPVREGWQDRSPFIVQEGKATFRHFEFVAQALAKIERGHTLDVEDVRAMLDRGLVSPEALSQAFAEIRPRLYRYPAIDPASFARALEKFLQG
jgi:hypothetical protein